MQFIRTELRASVVLLARAPESDERCIGRNYLIEENVSDQRRDEVESYEERSTDVREVVNRGHNSSTFDEVINDLALLPATVDPVQKIIRLERIDRHLEPIGGLDFDSLVEALRTGDQHRLSALADQFLNYSGERPSFAAFKRALLQKSDDEGFTSRIHGVRRGA